MFRFGDKHWTEHLIGAAQDWKFHTTLKPRLDVEILDWHDSQPEQTPHTITIDHVDQPDTTGLGPPLSIHWNFYDENSPSD